MGLSKVYNTKYIFVLLGVLFILGIFIMQLYGITLIRYIFIIIYILIIIIIFFKFVINGKYKSLLNKE